MLPTLVLIACSALVAGLLLADQRWRAQVSPGFWLPFAWLLILGSRPVSLWFAPSVVRQGGSAYLSYVDGNPVDRLIYLLMLVTGLIILARRDIRWKELLSSNKWLLLFFGYFAISAFWSEYPFVSLKRWVKDFGNLVMVLIILTDRNASSAVKTLLLRATYVLVPFSLVLVKYFPDISRSYRRWSGDFFYMGVNTDKNMFGMVLTILGVGLVWAALDLVNETPGLRRKVQSVVFAALMAMIFWLMVGANSATAIVCTALGSGVLIALRVRTFRVHVRSWGAVGLVTGTLLVMSGAWSALQLKLIGMLGRDPGLHGREDIWAAVLGEHTNPIIGVGFYGFWTPERVERLSLKYYYGLNEAHNGYLELYLTGGVISLALLVAVLWGTASRATKVLGMNGDPGLAPLSLAVVAVAIVYAITEAIFGRMDMIWFALLLVAASIPTTTVAATHVVEETLTPQRSVSKYPVARKFASPTLDGATRQTRPVVPRSRAHR